MAITKSAKKAAKRSVKLRTKNVQFKLAMKIAYKKLLNAKAKGDKVSDKMLSDTYRAIDKAYKAGIIKKNTAARKKSRVAKAFNK